MNPQTTTATTTRETPVSEKDTPAVLAYRLDMTTDATRMYFSGHLVSPI